MTIRGRASGFLLPPVPLVGDGAPVRCADGSERPYLSLDTAASTPPLETVLTSVQEFLPWYSSVHRGAGHKSQVSTRAYEDARSAALAYAGSPPPVSYRQDPHTGDYHPVLRSPAASVRKQLVTG
jgi:hypothetical protein